MDHKKEELNEQLHDLAHQLSELTSHGRTQDFLFQEKKFFTVVLAFSDHADGIAQYEVDSPRKALEMFIERSEALEGYDRNLVGSAINGLSRASGMKGVWSIIFTPLASGLEGQDENPILGGLIILTDSNECSQ